MHWEEILNMKEQSHYIQEDVSLIIDNIDKINNVPYPKGNLYLGNIEAAASRE